MAFLTPAKDDGLVWFLSPSDGGVLDPLKLAEDWFIQKDDRNKKLAAKRKELDEIKEEEHRRALETASRAVGSPPVHRFSTQGDLQHAGGVYPTPPDGVNSQGGRGSNAHDITSSTPGDAGESGVHDNGNEGVMMDVFGGETSSAALNVSTNQELFEIDEDMFEENGVTEADFSFFDEPDLDDSMLGTAQHEIPNAELRQDLELPQLLKSGEGDTSSEVEAKITISEIAEASNKGESSVDVLSVDETSLPEGLLPGQIELQAAAESSKHLPMKAKEKSLSPPLSPGHLLLRVLPRSKNQHDDGPRDQAHLYPTEDVHRKLGRPTSKRSGTFNSIVFNKSLNSSDQKYTSQGRFWYLPQGEEDAAEKDVIKRQRSNSAFPRDTQRNLQSSHSNPTLISASPVRIRRTISDPRRFWQDQASGTAMKPKEEQESSDDDDTSGSSNASGDEAMDCETEAVRSKPLEQDTVMSNSFQDLSFSARSRPPIDDELDSPLEDSNATKMDQKQDDSRLIEDRTKNPALTDDEFIRVAQIITGQIVHGTVWSWENDETKFLIESSVSEQSTFAGVNIDDTDGFSRLIFENATSTKLPPPNVRVQRAESSMELLPSAIPFWETFGLGPHGGPKDIAGIFIHPGGESIANAVHLFASRLEATYESSRLGRHLKGFAGSGSSADRVLIGIEVGTDGGTTIRNNVIEAIDAQCRILGILYTPLLTVVSPLTKVGQQIEQGEIDPVMLVVYLINPFKDPNALVDLATTFLRLINASVSGRPIIERRRPPKIVLQIVPMHLVASPRSIVSPPQNDFSNLAFEVYHRCITVKNNKPTDLSPAEIIPALVLTEALPTSINFKFKAHAPPLSLHEYSIFHIAYSRSIDGRWISAAWSDNYGKFEHTASYCLRRQSSDISRPVSEVMSEVWAATIEMIRLRGSRWRLLLVKDGVMTAEEVNCWETLSRDTQMLQVALSILDANMKSQLDPRSNLPPLSSQPSNPNVTSFTTPVSTPQPHMQSPDQSGNIATPASGPLNAATPTDQALDFDTEAILLDVTDETWGVVPTDSAHGKEHPENGFPAMVSGYLVKRGGSRDDDTPVAIKIRLLRMQAPTIQEILVMYRGLGTLGRLRNISHPVRSVAPWHLVAARRAQTLLSQIM